MPLLCNSSKNGQMRLAVAQLLDINIQKIEYNVTTEWVAGNLVSLGIAKYHSDRATYNKDKKYIRLANTQKARDWYRAAIQTHNAGD